jgi:hypothetical protein
MHGKKRPSRWAKAGMIEPTIPDSFALLPARIGTCDSCTVWSGRGKRGVTNEYRSAAPQDEDVIRDARWFPEHFDASSGGLSFVATDSDVLASQTFLDTRWDRGRAERRRANAASMTDQLPQELPRPNFIWHTGFCCSTLLAKALDRPGHNLSLCEPQILVEVADAKRAGVLARTSQSARIPQLIFHLLGRGFAPGARMTLKPAPAANCLVREAALHTSGPMLFLYSDCRSFLISIAKMGEVGRKYARRMFLAVLGDGHPPAQWPVTQLLSLSDLEIAALVWHMQVAEFLRNWPLLGTKRAFSLDCDAFLASPADVLARLDEIFSLNLGAERAREVAATPLFGRNAKDAERAYDSRLRNEEHGRVEEQLGGDLDSIVKTSYNLCRATPRGAPLPDPLVTIDKAYCS